MENSNLHMLNSHKVGVSLWIGQAPTYIMQTVINNSRYFDEFYLITTKDSFKQFEKRKNFASDGNLIHVDVEKFEDYILSVTKGITYLNAAQKSDILCYSALKFFNEFLDIKVNSIMVVDTDLWIYNRWLLKEIFNNCNEFICLKDQNLYVKYLPNKDLYNSGCSFDIINSMMYNNNILIQDALERISPNMRYTAIGPGLVNSSKYREIFDKNIYSKIEPFSLDPHILHSGKNVYKLKSYSLGLHYTDSIIKEVGYQVFDIEQVNDEIIISVI